MENRVLRAHFDGNQILLDEPFELKPNTELLVTILPKTSDDKGENWARLSQESLTRAYSEDEPEYTMAPATDGAHGVPPLGGIFNDVKLSA
jgi:hypothetical protein